MIDDQTESGATREHCPRWPNETNGEGHAMQSAKPAGTTLWVRSCSFCDWIDGEDLDAQRIAAEARGYARAVAALRERAGYESWCADTGRYEATVGDYADWLTAEQTPGGGE